MPELRQTQTPLKQGRSALLLRTLASDSAALARGASPVAREIPLNIAMEETHQSAGHPGLMKKILTLIIVLCALGAGYIFLWPILSKNLFG